MMRPILIAFLAALAALLVAERLTWRPAPQKIDLTPVQISPPPATRATTPLSNPRRIYLSAEFQQTPLQQALKQLEKLTGVKTAVVWKQAGRGDIDPDRPITLKVQGVSLSRTLRLVLNQAAGEDKDGLTFDMEDNVAVIRRISDDHTVECEIRFYDVRDILARAMARSGRSLPPFVSGYTGRTIAPGAAYTEDDAIRDLMALIRDTVVPESWVDNGGKDGSLKFFSGMLIVVQTPEKLELIEGIFVKLRQGGE
ncbi:MAG: hypothetical protein ACHRHE_11360 [Tepidisphaerales bacterium]